MGGYGHVMDDLHALQLAGLALEERLTALRGGALAQPSTCGDWSVYDLVNHVIGGGHRYLMLMQGAQAQAAELVASRSRDYVHPDPLAAFRQYQLPLAAAFTEPGAMSRICHHRAGDLPGAVLLRMRILELALHAWDLSASLDLPDELDEALCEHVLASFSPVIDAMRQAGFFGPPGERVPGAVTAQQELLRQTGRGRTGP